jgi:HEAT repeat protein/lysophospholipase L1-like esterase
MRLRELSKNVALSVAVSAALLALLEGVGRSLERHDPPPQRAEYIWDWEKQWDGDFYTLASDETGWPPGAEFNGDGLRDRTHAVEKPEGIHRLAFLGDSVTLGAGVGPDEAYPQVLQRRLDEDGYAVEVFNVALWGWTARQQRLAYERLLRKYSPDHVVVATCLNDIPEMKNNLQKPPRPLLWLHERSALVRVLVNAAGREIRSVEELFEHKDSAKVREGYALYFAELRALKAQVERDGARFSLLVFPFRFQVVTDAPPHAQDEIAAFCRAEGLACLDLLPALRQAGSGAFVDYDHLSATGAQVVAGELASSAFLAGQPASRRMLEEYASARGREGSALAKWLAGASGSSAAAAAAALLPATRGRDELRRAAFWALAYLGTAATPAVPALSEAIADADASVGTRLFALRALGALGPHAQAAVPALLAALGDARQPLRHGAADALHRVGVEPAHAEALARSLESQDAYVSSFAAFTLGELGAAAGEGAVHALIDRLLATGGSGRAGAAATLARLGPAAQAAVPTLIEELRAPREGRRWRAARTLGKIGPGAGAAVPALIETLADASPSVRLQSARALGRIGEAARPAIAALTAALRDADPQVRQEASRALSRIPGR